MKKRFVAVLLALTLFGFAGCKSTKKKPSVRGNAIAEFRYSAEIGNAKGYTYYRFYGDKTFSRGAYGLYGSQSASVETEQGTYEGDANTDGKLTMKVTATSNFIKGEWIPSSSADTETGKIQGSTFVFNGITYTKATK